MCFWKRRSQHWIWKKADKDIVCYKIMQKDFDGEKNDGVHSFQDKWTCYKVGDTMYPRESKSISELDDLAKLEGGVIHSFKSVDKRVEELWEYNYVCVHFPVLVECVIPKGTIYWENGREFASLKLVIKRKIRQ